MQRSSCRTKSGHYQVFKFLFKFLFPGIKAVRLLGTGKARLGPVDGDTARASPVPGGQGLHGVDGGSSSAAFPLSRCRRRWRRRPLSVWRGRQPSAAPLRQMMRAAVAESVGEHDRSTRTNDVKKLTSFLRSDRRVSALTLDGPHTSRK